MNQITLNISDYKLQCIFPTLDYILKRRIAKIFTPFMDGNSHFSHSRLTILPVSMHANERPDQELENRIKNLIKIYLSKFPFTGDQETELNILFCQIKPFLSNRDVIQHLRLMDRNESVSILTIDQGCLIQNHASFSSVLFLKSGFQWVKPLWDYSPVSTITKAIYFVTATSLPLSNAMMLHGTGIERQKAGLLFLGSSGAGKTTIARFCKEEDVLADDAVLLRKKNNHYVISSSPFNTGKSMFQKESRLTMVLFIEKDTYHGLEVVPPATAGSIILKNHIHFFRNFSTEAVRKTFHQVADLCREVPFYKLHFKKDSSFLKVIDQQLTESCGFIGSGG